MKNHFKKEQRGREQVEDQQPVCNIHFHRPDYGAIHAILPCDHHLNEIRRGNAGEARRGGGGGQPCVQRRHERDIDDEQCARSG